MRRATRILMTLAVIVGVVVALGVAFAGGLPRPVRALPSGAVADMPTYRNVLADGAFTAGRGVAAGWMEEHTTALPPSYARTVRGQEISYRGQPGDTGPGHKIEVFQSVGPISHNHLVGGGQRWQFTVRIASLPADCSVIVGAEWFKANGHTVNGVTGYSYQYLAESDVYPHLGLAPQDIAVVTPPLPADAGALAVYVQIAEVSPATNVSVTISAASLVRVG
jgi:hypothetical protein